MDIFFTIPQPGPVKESVCSFFEIHRRNNPPVHETIIPKGGVEVIFSFESTRLHAEFNGQTLNFPRCFIQGFHTIPIHLHLSEKQALFGVVIQPAAARYIFHHQPVAFSNCIIDLTLVDPSFYWLWESLAEQENFQDRICVFTEWLVKRLPGLTAREQAFNHLLGTHENSQLSVTGISKQMCYSSRQLSRKLYELTGMNTEQVLLYKKYLHAVHLMHFSRLSLTEIAYSCHFSDQSHFIKTFKSLSQVTPRAYRESKAYVPGHLVEIVR